MVPDSVPERVEMKRVDGGARRTYCGTVRPQLNHTIAGARDPDASATFMADIIGLDPPTRFGSFHVVEAGNGVSIDFVEVADEADVEARHYAFLVTEAQFDQIFERIRSTGIAYWADPGQTKEGEINHHDGGRGVYFPDPAGHLLEIITRPYGSGPSSPA